MEEKSDNPTEQEDSKEQRPSQRKPEKTIMGPFVIVLLILNFFLAFYIYFNQKKLNTFVDQSVKESLGPERELPDDYKLHQSLKAKKDYTLSSLEFNNLQANFKKQNGPKRYLSLSFTLILETPKSAPLNESIGLKAKINDRIYAMTNKLSYKSVLKLSGREIYKQLLLRNINNLLKQDRAERVLFTQFLVR